MFKSIRGLVVVLALVGTMSTAAMAGPLGRVVARVLPGKMGAKADRPSVFRNNEQIIIREQPVAVENAAPRQAPAFAPTATSNPVESTAMLQAVGRPDLVLEDVSLAAGPTRIAGPAYAVRFYNQGLQPAGKFVVAVFASLDGRPNPEAPRALLEVPGLGAGEAREVVLRLPAAALHMGPQDVEFSHLILLVDAGNTVQELDESNNVAAIERASLESAQ